MWATHPPWSWYRRSGRTAALFLVLFGLLAAATPSVLAEAEVTSQTPEVLPRRLYLPLMQRASACPATSDRQYTAIPYTGLPADIPAALHPDFNLSVRGWISTGEYTGLVTYGGAEDVNAPKIPGVYSDNRIPAFTTTYRVYNWNWDRSCGSYGCRAGLISVWPVTLLGTLARPGEVIHAPYRAPEIYGGGYIALVLYADERRITLKYTREDSVVYGYTVHLENVCVDPNLLSVYRLQDASGRPRLPALHNWEALGTAATTEVLVAVRDNGSFMDPRSHSDWWQYR